MSLDSLLPADKEIRFPEFILLRASAGTGKTHALTLRFTQFLLSDRIKANQPGQILAITFTRNAAKEMKSRILGWLKDCYFGKKENITQILDLLTIPEDQLKIRAEQVLENILSHYSDFQVMTIDSFMAEVFKASAIDLGVSPDFELTLDATPTISYAFSRFLRGAGPGTSAGKLLLEIARSLQSLRDGPAKFFWDPTEEIRNKFLELYSQLEAANRRPVVKDLVQAQQELRRAEEPCLKSIDKLKALIKRSGLELNKTSAYYKRQNSRRISDWLNCSFKTPPVQKPLHPREKLQYDRIEQEWKNLEHRLKALKIVYARNYFQPYLQVYQDLLTLVEVSKKEQSLVFLEDVHRKLAGYLDQGLVPDIYFCLGTSIYHYLIDEFQDTSPLQWQNLEPLIENALSQGGSLFIVGDTKQAIYGFREADYRIMVDFINGQRSFASVPTKIKDLTINRRSQKEILDFISAIFPNGLKTLGNDRLALMKEAASRSGLDDFICLPSPEKAKKPEAPGYVEMEFITPEKDEDQEAVNKISEADQLSPEMDDQETRVKKRIQELVQELVQRGYRYSDIAILAYRNETVAEISAWLNEKGVPFVPYSSLDIRKRPIIKEILAFLQFLDFPLDDLNFSVFILGQVFQNKLKAEGWNLETGDLREFILSSRHQPRTRTAPLYTIFRMTYPEIWEAFFEDFFKSVGYLPLYDLVSQAYRSFDLLNSFPDEQAALIRLLEVIKYLEGQGKSNLRDFISFSESPSDEKSIWTVDVPEEIPAVKIMTIHKAKGLGFPVVILLLFPQQYLNPTFFLGPTGKKENAGEKVEILKLNENLIAASPELEQVYRAHRLKDEVNRLNTLYVGLTRARKELYIIGVPGKRKFYPFDFLEGIGFIPQQKFRSPSPRPARISPEASPWAAKKMAPEAGLTILPTRNLLSPAEEPGLNYREQRLGSLLHALLAEIEYLEPNLEQIISQTLKKPIFKEFSRSEIEWAEKKVKKLLSRAGPAEYFQKLPGRKIWREIDLVNSEGQLFRVDRVVIDPDRITLIDFKNRKPKEPVTKDAYFKQLSNYRAILQELFPETEIKPLLIYVESGTMEPVP